MNPYIFYTKNYEKLYNDGKIIKPGVYQKLKMNELQKKASKVMLFSPHPDDECITGLLPLKLRREKNFNIINVAVTLGSNKARQQERWQELKAACDYLNFNVIRPTDSGLENVNLKTRENAKNEWLEKVDIIAKIIKNNTPEIIIFPHKNDWNSTHIGVHYLLIDALKSLDNFICKIVETEYWSAMKTPNLMLPATADEVGELITALSFHIGEIERNPYHLTLPAWMMDNVRRGAELVGGQGGQSPDFVFATLYRIGIFHGGEIIPDVTVIS